MRHGKTSAIVEVENLIGKMMLFVSRKRFYELCTKFHPFVEETESSKKPNVCRGPGGLIFMFYYCRRAPQEMLLVYLEHQIRL